MRYYYDKQLKKLNGYMAWMGQLIEKAIQDALSALLSHDMEKAKETIHYDAQINHLEREIENLCFHLLLSQQPVASDLRFVSSALKMITDMERIGDHAADISEITLILNGSGFPEDLQDIRKMAEETTSMVKASIDAYVERSTQKAIEVIHQDDVVDQWFIHIKKSVISQINENIQNGEEAADVLMIAKYLERIADHAVNIAEWVLFCVTGRHPDPQEK